MYCSIATECTEKYIDTATKTIKNILQIHRYGGKLIRRDQGTLLLMDYDAISQQEIDSICTQHPYIDVHVSKCESSKSGYIVTFTAMPSSLYFSSSTCALYFIIVITYCLCIFQMVQGSLIFE
jgi:hypothetical protein